MDIDVISLWHNYRFGVLIIVTLLFLAYRFQLFQHDKESQQACQTSESLRNTSSPKSDTKSESSPRIVSKEKSEGPKRIIGNRKLANVSNGQVVHETFKVEPVIIYFSLGGTTTAIAEALKDHFDKLSEIKTEICPPQLLNLVEIDFDTYFVSPRSSNPGTQQFYLLLLPTYNIDTELDTFLESLKDTHHDFRIDTSPLNVLAGYSVFGIGDKEHWPTENQGYCSQAKEVDKWMAKLTGRKRAYPVGMGDCKTDLKESIAAWRDGVVEVVESLSNGNGLGQGAPGSGEAVESEDEADEEFGSTKKNKKSSSSADLEDIRAPPRTNDNDNEEDASGLEIDFTTTSGAVQNTVKTTKEMVPVNGPTYTALTKQGYTIVGSHSGVKLCRWTKSALRGRGSCYKYSFYGINSHQCMETTPSLSCSNKCVFCWRHGTNPVSTTWRWVVDPPDLIFNGVKEGHYKKIKMMRGVPGVRAERFAEGMKIRHCALSLVGEPIFYPHINELLSMLHKERISSFLVCNAQHPDQLEKLGHVTQLYVSIDASNKEALKRIDRPLHRDFWERFLRCMDILRSKRDMQRTVFRLTLVKGFNIEDEAEGYADLVDRARPGLIEVKGVTYCGTSTSSAAGLTMGNVPFYDEVQAFVEALVKALEKRGLDYGLAAEHSHSCCILIGERQRFYRKETGWHTLIDYEKFFDCLESGKEFGPADYIGPPTPQWALYGNGGFDPRDERVDRKGRPKEDMNPPRKAKVIEL